MIKQIKHIKDQFNPLIGKPEDSDNNLIGIRFYSGSGYYVNDPVYVYAKEFNEDVLERASLLDPNCAFLKSEDVIEGEDITDETTFFKDEEAYDRALSNQDDPNFSMALFDKDGYVVGYTDAYTYVDRTTYGNDTGYILVDQIKIASQKRDENNTLQNEFFKKFN